MAPRNEEKLAKKNAYLDNLKELLRRCPNILIIHVDNVGSLQMQEIRTALRKKAVIVMGKNTMIRTAIRQYEAENEETDFSDLLNVVNGNIGFCFCIGAVDEIRQIIQANRVPASAKAGTIALADVNISAGATGLDPSSTSFFQALNIATKIVKGSVEIVSDVSLLKTGTKVTASQAALLIKLNIRPFEYRMNIHYVCDNGSVFDAAVLEITNEVIVTKFLSGVRNVAAFSREIGMPNEASLPHAIVNAFKNCAALCCDIEYSFKEIVLLKEFVKDPSKFASAAAAPVAAAGGAKAAPVVVEEEEEADMGFDLFD